jgi:DNA-binding MarR family transcriptional regulator
MLLMEAEIVAALSDTTRLIRRAFDAKARAIGVTRPQWQVLIMLRRHDGINQGGLAELLEVEPITVGRMIDRLQDAELVERRADPTDRRTWRLHLTARAEALIEQLRPLADDLFEDAFGGLSVDDRTQLSRTLDRIRQNLSRRADAPLVSHG